LHREQPANAAYTATYAFSLFRQGKFAEAAAAMNELTPDQSNDPSVSLYYGIFLAAAGDVEKSKPFLQAAGNARMFPEERQLLAEAKKRAGLE
jgi:predicted Zn-dependent protease